jgi:RNA polymerase primary sigma factor
MEKRTIPGTRNRNQSTARDAGTQPVKLATAKPTTGKQAAKLPTGATAKKTTKPAVESAAKGGVKSENNQVEPATREAGGAATGAAARKPATRTKRRAGTTKTHIDSHDVESASIDAIQNGNLETRSISIPDMQATGADAIREYLRDIGKVKLLDSELEVALARQIEVGRGAAEKLGISLENEQGEQGQDIDGGSNPNIPKDQVEALLREIRLGNQAKDALIEANLRLVVSIAKRYRNRGMAFLDLIQEGNLGLMRAVEKFDYRKGFKFSTYATWWIRQSIIRALADQSRTIRIPVHVVEEMNRVLRAQRQWLQDKGREPTLDEISAKLFIHPERIKEILRMNQDTLSLEQPIGDQEMSLSDIIEDKRNEDPDDSATRTMLHDAVVEALKTLPERDRKVMELRFGLTDDGRRHTLEEVAKACMVTRERIRQIEIKTLAKLRKPDAAHALREFLDGG